MKRGLSVILLMIALVCSSSLGLFQTSAENGQGFDSSQLSGAATLLKTTGQPGMILVPEPPFGNPVFCGLEWQPEFPEGTYAVITLHEPMPVAFPQGNGPQTIGLIVKLYRRLPNGSLQLVNSYGPGLQTATYFNPANFSLSFGIMGQYNLGDSGSKYVLANELLWYDGNSNVVATVEFAFTSYITHAVGYPDSPVKDSCDPFLPAIATLGIGEGTVNQSIPFSITRFPADPNVSIYFDGILVGSVATKAWGEGSRTFLVPAKPMGPHKVKFYRYGRTATATFTIKPRIKLIPNTNLHRGQTVNVSLRGYKAGEVVRIRRKNGSSWVELTRVTTTSTGSKNINVKVPSFAPNGPNSVRGDSVNATGGRAQTNAVTVSGGPTSGAAAKASPTPTKAPAETATLTPTAIPATSTPIATVAPTQTVAAPSVTATPTATATSEATTEPTATSTPSPTATVPPSNWTGTPADSAP